MRRAALVVLVALGVFSVSCARSAIDPELLCRHWVQSYEEQRSDDRERIFRPAGFKTFPPSRFRMDYKFGRDGGLEWLFLSPDDAHRFKAGTWAVDPKDGAVLRITTDEATESYRVTALTADQLRWVRVEPENGN